MVAVDNKKLVQNYWKAISGKIKTPELSEVYVSDQELLGHIAFFDAAFPKYEILPDDMISEEDKVVVRGRFIGVNKGELLGMSPTGKKVEVPFSIIYQIADDRICKSWLFIDRMELMEQLGVNFSNN